MRANSYGPRMAALIGLLAIMLAIGAGALAASPSETLQKAIYTEETVGNLDEAIKLYELVIADGKAARNAAAQAQYRLALIYLKRGKTSEANAAFEKLIKEYPEENDLVAKARGRLPGEIKLEPAPWKDHEALQLVMKTGDGRDIGTYIYMIDSATHDGRDAWRCSTRSYSPLSGSGYSTVLVEKESFAPIISRWRLPVLGDVQATYKPQSVELKNLLKNTTREVHLEGQEFDNEECAELMRRLPLAVGYKTTLPIMSTLGGEPLRLELNVVGKQAVDVAAGKFECFKVSLPAVGQDFFYSADANRTIVKFDAGVFSVELARISILEPGKPTRFESDAFSVTLPYHWFTYAPNFPAGKDRTTYLLDIDGTATITVKELSDRAAAKAWAETAVVEIGKSLKAFAIREGSLRFGPRAGHDSASFLADFTDRDTKMVTYVTYIVSGNHAVTIAVRLDAGQFEAVRAELDKVIDSVQLK